MTPITFTEHAMGATITDQYQGIVFDGDCFITTDGAHEAAGFPAYGHEVLSGWPRFSGPIAATFTESVANVQFTIGYLDNLGAVEVVTHRPDGSTETRALDFLGTALVKLDGRVTGFTVQAAEFESAGFSLDNLSWTQGFVPAPAARITGRRDGLGPLGGAHRLDTAGPSRQQGFRPGAPGSYY